jgi:Protein of unknown function (DUF3017)
VSTPEPSAEPGLPEEEHRPYPDPSHDITPRKPRTAGGVLYLAMLAATATALVLIALDRWRTGLALLGGALLVGALARLVLPQHQAGMMGIRRKLVDVSTLLLLGGGLTVLAFLIPGRPAS